MSSLWLHSNHMKVMKSEPCAMCQKRGRKKKTPFSSFRKQNNSSVPLPYINLRKSSTAFGAREEVVEAWWGRSCFILAWWRRFNVFRKSSKYVWSIETKVVECGAVFSGRNLNTFWRGAMQHSNNAIFVQFQVTGWAVESAISPQSCSQILLNWTLGRSYQELNVFSGSHYCSVYLQI